MRMHSPNRRQLAAQAHAALLSSVPVITASGVVLPCCALPSMLCQAQARSSRYRLWEEQELIDLCSSVGLEGYKRIRSFRYIMFTAKKPDGLYL